MSEPITATAAQSDAAVITVTKAWLETAVIGLNLCPFANAVFRKNQIRYVVCNATQQQSLETSLSSELGFLQATDPQSIDTTLLIHPHILQDFFDYNGFLNIANRLIKRSGLHGILQIASFHPQYEFAHCAPDAPENYTNRSPYPMLHLLREESIKRAVASFADTDNIYRRNIDTLQHLGIDGWNRLWQSDRPESSSNQAEVKPETSQSINSGRHGHRR